MCRLNAELCFVAQRMACPPHALGAQSQFIQVHAVSLKVGALLAVVRGMTDEPIRRFRDQLGPLFFGHRCGPSRPDRINT